MISTVACWRAPERLDLLLTGGHVIDGAGGPPFAANVGILDGRIHYLGTYHPEARELLDITGLTVTPGFVHQARTTGAGELGAVTRAALRGGVTSLVLGADADVGLSGLRQLLQASPDTMLFTNVGVLIGASALRRESQDAAAILDNSAESAMIAGALGIVATMSDTWRGAPVARDTLVELAKWTARTGNLFLSDGRDPVVQRFAPAFEWMDDVPRRLGRGASPGSVGFLARVFEVHVRDLKLTSSEEAVRLLTSVPAEALRLHDRGLVKEGYVADLLVIAIHDVRLEPVEDPDLSPSWLRHVLLAGVPAVRDHRVVRSPGGALLVGAHSQPRE